MNLRNYSSGFLRRQQKLTKSSTCFDINIKHYNKEERKNRQIIKRQFSFFPDEELPGLKIQEKYCQITKKLVKMAGGQHYSLRWNNHESHVLKAFDSLLQNEALVDCTLVCEDQSIRAHKVVLSACR